jgi:transposase
LRKDYPARVFSDIIDRFDNTGFQKIKSEGRPRFDIRMMLKVLLWSYANGVRASRKIEEKLHSDVVFMWLAGLEKPDFRTICLFRRANLARLNYLFSEVIVMTRALGLIRLGLIALDGTKIRANAAVDSFKKVKDWSAELTKAQAEVHRIFAEAEAADLADDKKYGSEFRGDEIPRELEKTETRIKRIEKLMDQIKSTGKTDNNRVSSTDSDASFMHHKGGSVPAYNAELSVTEDQIIVHSDVTT